MYLFCTACTHLTVKVMGDGSDAKFGGGVRDRYDDGHSFFSLPLFSFGFFGMCDHDNVIFWRYKCISFYFNINSFIFCSKTQ